MRVLLAFYGGCLSETVVDAEVDGHSTNDPFHPVVQCYQATNGKVGSRFRAVQKDVSERQSRRSSRLECVAIETQASTTTGSGEREIRPQQYEIIERLEHAGTLVLVAEYCCDELVADE